MTTGRWSVLGVPIDSVGRSGGTEHGPEALRRLGLVEALAAEDGGDLDVRIRGEERHPETGIVASDDVIATTATLRDAVAREIAAGRRPLLAGGCCAELPGALAGARDALERVGLVHVDGHLDIYDGVTSPTGEAADMPVAVGLGIGPRAWVSAAGGASVSSGDVVILAHRDQEQSRADGMVQPEELSPEPIHPSAEDVRGEGPAAVGERVAAAFEGVPFWMHLDVDVLDEEVFPATDYLSSGGLDWDELVPLLRPLAASPQLLGLSIGCYNPDKDPGAACGRALVEALGDCFA